jgi:Carbohydrate family 9 binding domain-like
LVVLKSKGVMAVNDITFRRQQNYLCKVTYIGIILCLFCKLTLAQDNTPDFVNLEHLKFLTEVVTIAGEPMALVHIYSEAPDYGWVDAAGEGLSALDDVARGALVYLWQYERTGETELLELAKACLNFVMYMQTDDGSFYNFVTDRDGTKNTTGNTSFKSLGWWAMRGLWALGEGIRVFTKLEPEYAARLETAYLKTETALANALGNYGETIALHSFEIPAWIPGGEPTVASIGVLGMVAYYRANPNQRTAAVITKIADGLAQYRLGDHTIYPFGMHPLRSNAPGFWHDWGSHVSHALAEAGSVLKKQAWIDSAAAEADSFLLRQVAFERFRDMGVVPNRLGQIAYGTNSIIQTYMALYRATGETRYAELGGLAASWYFGNNMASQPVYFPENGRVLDGIDGPAAWRVNRNAGAESTIEGLMSMIVIADVPVARDLLDVKTVDSSPYLILEAEAGERVVGTPQYYSNTWTGEGYISAGRYVGLAEGQRMRMTVDLQQAGEYWLYVAHQRQSASSSQYLIPYQNHALTIDAKSNDWSKDSSVLSSDASAQFLRGAGSWQGAQADSHHVRLAWDEKNLYLLAEVRDPKHQQPFTLRNVGGGDTLWLYLTSTPDAQRLSAKLTLAQTPDGSQVWNWQQHGFLERAELAFAVTEGGYAYEVALPWAALEIEPQPGRQFGLEAGRGIGGESFMDLTGRDPDIAANLLRLELAGSEPSSDESGSQVNLRIKLDDLDDVTLEESISPDSNYFWLDLVNPEPYELEAGNHTLRYRSQSVGDNPGNSKVDAFYLQPVVAQKVFEHPDGRRFVLTYDTSSGESHLRSERE